MAGLGLQRLQRSAHFAFAKAEVAQRGEDLGSKLELCWVDALAIGAAVRVSDAQRAAGAPLDQAALDQDRATMGGAVMR